jgi:hypothetical protein
VKTIILCLSLFLVLAAFAALLWDDRRYVTRRRRRVGGVVTGHRSRREEDGIESFAAILRFENEDGASVEIVDRLFRPTCTPPIGTRLILEHPLGLPDKARVRRPGLRLFLYLFLVYGAAILVLALLGRV